MSQPHNPLEAFRILKLIAEDMQEDARRFEGQPFNGKTVATYLGNLGAGVAAIADILAEYIQAQEGRTSDRQRKESPYPLA